MRLRPLLLLSVFAVTLNLRAARTGVDPIDWDAISDLRTSPDLNRLNRGPRWLDDYDQARHVARQQNTTLLVLFVKQDDPFSNRMKTETLSDPKVWRYLRRYTLVEVDVERDPELAFQYELRAVPALLWLDAEGRELHRAVGFAPAGDLTAYMERILTPGAVELPPDQAGLLQRFKENPTDRELMVQMLVAIRTGEEPRRFLSEVRSIRPAPVTLWVELLSHPTLGIRLGALELLEEVAGDTFGYDAWEAPDQQEVQLNQWNNWAESQQGKELKRFAPLTKVQLTNAVRDLDNGSETHVNRAVRTLETGGPALLPHINETLKNEGLSEQQKTKLREVRLSLQIASLGWQDAPGVSFRLRRGPLDTRMQLLRDMTKEGPASVPILSQFLDDPEALIRETALEGLLQAGGRDAIPAVLERLKVEPSTDIALTAMRQLAKVHHQEATAWLESQLNSGQEERILGALTAMQSGAHDRLASLAVELLKDDRWRIRATAATTLGAIRHQAALPDLLKSSSDPDAFARTAALDACLTILRDKDKQNELVEKWYEKNPEDIEVLIRVICNKRMELPENMLSGIKEFKKENILGVLQVIVDCQDTSIPVALEFADHTDEDIRASALRVLAINGLVTRNQKTKKQVDSILGKALREESDAVRTVLLEHLRIPRPQRNSYQSGFVPFTPYSPNGASAADASGELDELMGAFTDKVAPTPVPEPEGASLDDMMAAFEEPDPAKTIEGEGVEATLQSLFAKTDSEELRSLIAIRLAVTGNEEAIQVVAADTSPFVSDQLTSLISGMKASSINTPLVLSMLNDNRGDVRSEALEWLARNATATEFLPLLDELGQENSRARLNDIPLGSWALKYGLRELNTHEVLPYLTKWLEMKEEPKREDLLRQALALSLAMQHPSDDLSEAVAVFADTEQDPEFRAMAWLYRAIANRGLSEEEMESVQQDSATLVRNVIPFLYVQSTNKSWIASPTYLPGFEVEHSAVNGRWTLRLNDESEERLQAMVKDSMPEVAFLSGVALFSNNKPVEESEVWTATHPVAKRSPWLTQVSTYAFQAGMRRGSLPPEVTSLLVSMHGKEIMDDIQTASGRGTGIDPDAAPLDLAAGSVQNAEPSPPVILYFYETGCGDCEVVSTYLESYLQTYPELEVRSLDMASPEAAELYTAIYRKQGISLTQVGLTPMIAGAGLSAAGSEDLTHERIGEIIQSSMAVSGDQWIPIILPQSEDIPDFDTVLTSLETSDTPDESETSTSSSRPVLSITRLQGLLLGLIPAMALLLLPNRRSPGKGWWVLPAAFVVGAVIPVDIPTHMAVITALVGTPFLVILQIQDGRNRSKSLSDRIQSSSGFQGLARWIASAVVLFVCGLALPLPYWGTALGLVTTGTWLILSGLTAIAGLSRFMYPVPTKCVAAIAMSGMLVMGLI